MRVNFNFVTLRCDFGIKYCLYGSEDLRSWILGKDNMSIIHYKFKSSLEYDCVAFDGFNISVADLKKAIIDQKKLGKNGQFHLSITDAQTKKAYISDSDLIPRNACVIISRVPIGGPAKKTSKIIEDALNARSASGVVTNKSVRMSWSVGSLLARRCR